MPVVLPGGLLGKGLAVLDGAPASLGGVQHGLGNDGVRGEVAQHRLPAAGAAGLVTGGHGSAGRMPLLMVQNRERPFYAGDPRLTTLMVLAEAVGASVPELTRFH